MTLTSHALLLPMLCAGRAEKYSLGQAVDVPLRAARRWPQGENLVKLSFFPNLDMASKTLDLLTSASSRPVSCDIERRRRHTEPQ